MKKTLALAGFALLSLSTLSFAQTTNIVAWNFSAATPSSGLFTGLATPTVVQGNNNGTTTMLTTTSPSSGYTTAAGFTASTAGNAGAAAFKPALNLATSTYFGLSLSLDPSAAGNYTLTDVSLGSRQTSTGPGLLSLYSSTDGFVTDFTFLGSASVLNNSIWAAVDFSGLSTLILDDSSTTSFRIYGSSTAGGTPSAGTANWRIDDLAVTLVTNPVPEPSTLALTSLGVVGLLVLRRRSK